MGYQTDHWVLMGADEVLKWASGAAGCPDRQGKPKTKYWTICGKVYPHPAAQSDPLGINLAIAISVPAACVGLWHGFC